MAEIIANEGGGKKGGKRRAKKLSTHIDMTPMVDLACLLLTFFMLTTAFSKPKVMEIVLPEPPKKDDPKPPEISEKRTVNFILDEKGKVYWYNGMIHPGKPAPELHETDFSKDGVRKILLQRNKEVFNKIEILREGVVKGTIKLNRDSVASHEKAIKREDKVGPIVLIKATDKVKYGDMVNMIDEMAITNIGHYAIVKLEPSEKKLVDAAKGIVPKK